MSAMTSGGIQSLPGSNGTPVSNVYKVDIAATFGAVATLVGLTATATCTGLITTDAVAVNCLGAMPAGSIIANARVSASDVIEITFVTAVVAGVSLGSLNYRITVFR